MHTNLQWQETDQQTPGDADRMEGGITKGHGEAFGGDVCMHYLDCSDGFPGVCKSKLINLYTLNRQFIIHQLYLNKTVFFKNQS